MKLSIATDIIDTPPEEFAARSADAEPLLVLKFGSSVLGGIDDLPAVAGEIYRQRRLGRRIVAVVSALAGETDRLFEEARKVSGNASCAGVADLVSQGEERTAALLRIACDRIGLPAAICRAEELGLETRGAELDADLGAFDPAPLLRKLSDVGLVIVPGFVGIGRGGERNLLGRGGSDFTAAIIGGALGADVVRLYKDVDGVFEQDPAANPEARKFAEVSHGTALRLAQQLIHSKAVEHAAQLQVPIEVESIGSNSPTRIGARSRLLLATPARSRLRIALAGYGVVGQALAARLRTDPRFEVTGILVRDCERPRQVAPIAPLTDRPKELLEAECDVLVELLSCEETGAALCCAKLGEGVDVVTASKRMVSGHFGRLRESAGRGSANVLHSATIGGSSPFLETIARAKQRGSVAEISGILNGTVNFVLERIHRGLPLDAAIGLAQTLGFAEENTESDLSGADAAAKLMIAGSLAFDCAPDEVVVTAQRLDEGVARHIRESRQRWVQLSTVRRADGEVSAEVVLRPASLAELPAAPDEWNVGRVQLSDGSRIAFRGRGAGGPATAEAVLADLYDLLHRREVPAFGASVRNEPRPQSLAR